MRSNPITLSLVLIGISAIARLSPIVFSMPESARALNSRDGCVSLVQVIQYCRLAGLEDLLEVGHLGGRHTIPDYIPERNRPVVSDD